MTQPTLTLYNYWRSSSSWRVRIALEFKGLEYGYESVHLVHNVQQEPWFSELNPMKQVPLLKVEAGEQTHALAQSVAIFEWLEETFPEPPLMPSDPIDRARVRQLAEIVNSGIQPIQNLTVIRRLKALEQDATGWCADFIRDGLANYEAIVAKTSDGFSFGDAPSWADACLVPQLYNARRFGLDVDEFPTIAQIETRCFELDAFQASHPDQQPDAVKS